MSQSPDIFGIAFRDYQDGNTNEHINVRINISDEDDELPVSYFFRSFSQMPLWEQKSLQACKGKVLDVGAGAGSHSLYLQNRGLEVTAVDISEGAVECMKQRGIKNAIAQDFFQLSGEQYDTILFLMNGTGMAQNLSKLKDLLMHAKSLLSPRGLIYLESTDILYMFEDDEDGSVMINLAGKYYGEIDYHLSYKQYAAEPFPWLFVDYDNLSNVAELCGLQCEKFFEGETDNYVARLSFKE